MRSPTFCIALVAVVLTCGSFSAACGKTSADRRQQASSEEEARLDTDDDDADIEPSEEQDDQGRAQKPERTMNTETRTTSGADGLVVEGERFSRRMIEDRQQGGLPVGVVMIPEQWRFASDVRWNYAHHSNPVTLSSSAENPANEEACFGFPAAQFFELRPQTPIFQRGQNVGGLIFAQPLAPADTLLSFVRYARGNQPGLRLIGSKELPGLAAALRLPSSPQQRGVGVKITYQLNGRPVEEEFYAVYYSVDIPYDGPLGRTWQINWGLTAIHSFRAPLGTLDQRRPVFATMTKSFRPNPAWEQRLAAVNAYLQQEFNRQIQAGYDSIAAAGALSRQISANNDAFLAGIDRQLEASRRSSASSAQARSANDKFSDYIRGVDTVDDPYYGTSQHSYTERYHWTDGYGNYRNSNSAMYNPNESENGNWTIMNPVR